MKSKLFYIQDCHAFKTVIYCQRSKAVKAVKLPRQSCCQGSLAVSTIIIVCLTQLCFFPYILILLIYIAHPYGEERADGELRGAEAAAAEPRLQARPHRRRHEEGARDIAHRCLEESCQTKKYRQTCVCCHLPPQTPFSVENCGQTFSCND